MYYFIIRIITIVLLSYSMSLCASWYDHIKAKGEEYYDMCSYLYKKYQQDSIEQSKQYAQTCIRIVREHPKKCIAASLILPTFFITRRIRSKK